jgi:hypothetical protein
VINCATASFTVRNPPLPTGYLVTTSLIVLESLPNILCANFVRSSSPSASKLPSSALVPIKTGTDVRSPRVRRSAGEDMRVLLSATGVKIRFFCSMTLLIFSALTALKHARRPFPLHPSSSANFAQLIIFCCGSEIFCLLAMNGGLIWNVLLDS